MIFLFMHALINLILILNITFILNNFMQFFNNMHVFVPNCILPIFDLFALHVTITCNYHFVLAFCSTSKISMIYNYVKEMETKNGVIINRYRIIIS